MYLHTLLGPHKYLSAVNVGVEINALFLYLSELCKGEHLKAARISKNRLIPVHKLMQAAHFIDNIITRANVQVVGIAKLDLRFKVIAKVYRRNTALDSRRCADIHKHGGLNSSVNGYKFSAARKAVFFYQFKHQILLFIW